MTLQVTGMPEGRRPLYFRHPIYRIQRAVCEAYGIPPDIFLTQDRHYKIAHPRQLAMYLSRTLTHSSLQQIGVRFGGRHHTTVMTAVRKIERLSQTNEKLRLRINSIKGLLDVAMD